MASASPSTNLRPVTSLDDDHARQLHQLYQNEWWTEGRALDDVRRMLQHSDYLFGTCRADTNELVAFASVLTDRTFKALIFDVIVDPRHRGDRLGAALVDRILRHPDLASVKHFELYCLPELIPFYERWGFSADVGSVVLVRKQGSMASLG
jgi:predicted N-acetyltransferase YhbS